MQPLVWLPQANYWGPEIQVQKTKSENAKSMIGASSRVRAGPSLI